MNPAALYLVVSIVIEVWTVALCDRGKLIAHWELHQAWEHKFNLYGWGQVSPASAWCYGFTGGGEYTIFLDPKDDIVLTVSSITYKKKPLYGWFHLKLTTKDPKIVALEHVVALVEGALDVFAVAGSFVRTKFGKGTNCDTTQNAKDKYDYKPCQWAVDPYILAHNTFARKKPKGQGETRYEWNVKIDFPLCHIYYEKNAIYFRIITSQFSSSNHYLPLQKWIYLKDHNYGAPDPEPPSGATDVDCSKEADNTTTEWVKERGPLVKNISTWLDSCNIESLRTYTAEDKIDQYTWGGRCPIGYDRQLSNNLQRDVPRVTNKYHCRRRQSERMYIFGKRLLVGSTDGGYIGDNPDNYVNWTPPAESWTYPEINGYLKEALEFATRECKNETCTNVIKEQTNIGVSASSSIGRYIFAGRQGHGILMVIASLFVYPLTNFVSRYFKGTFMSTRYIANLHPWLAVHIYGTLTTLTLLVTGVGMGIYAREYLGYSFHIAGRAHVAFGYIAFLLFLGGLASNALRCGKKAKGNCSIILHACFGVSFYYLSLVAIAMSVGIPASPGGKKLKRASELDTIANSALVIVTLLFPIFEIIIHVMGTIQMCKRDVRFGVLRDWACFVAIPRVAAGEHHDEAGTDLKSMLFVVYLLGASLATIVALGTIGTSNPDGYFFDKMTYTHVKGKLSTMNIEVNSEAKDVLE